jgi:D-ribose pyranose/furanose isomerase RbsD
MPAYYGNTVSDFIADDPKHVFLRLVTANEGFSSLWRTSIEVWGDEVSFLQTVLRSAQAKLPSVRDWGVLLEFPIPRRQKRIDVVLLAGDLIIVLELKTNLQGTSAFAQAEDYALDLEAFHAKSAGNRIAPVVVSTGTTTKLPERINGSPVMRPGTCNRDDVSDFLVRLSNEFGAQGEQIDWREWDTAMYRPVPTIIDAARAIFAGMEVREIAHAQSDPHNLTTTVDRLVSLVEDAVRTGGKLICFVTGVPGSGKTLAGLRAVHDERLRLLTGSDPAFFSGNGPLVKILREALIRDAVQIGEKRSDVSRRVTAMVPRAPP